MSSTPSIAPGIAFYSTDPTFGPAECRAFEAAQTLQLAEFCAAHSREPIAAVYYADRTKIPAGMPTIPFVPECDDAEALAYHTEGVDGRITGMVGVQTCAKAGVSATSAGSHEFCETALDPFVNGYAQMPDGKLVATEACDPVQDQSYKINVTVDGKSVDVEMSNYVLPAWFDDDSRGDKYDRLGSLTAPFTRTSGGYWVEMSAGKQTQVGARASHKPKAALARGVRRLAPCTPIQPLSCVHELCPECGRRGATPCRAGRDA